MCVPVRACVCVWGGGGYVCVCGGGGGERDEYNIMTI